MNKHNGHILWLRLMKFFSSFLCLPSIKMLETVIYYLIQNIFLDIKLLWRCIGRYSVYLSFLLRAADLVWHEEIPPPAALPDTEAARCPINHKLEETSVRGDGGSDHVICKGGDCWQITMVTTLWWDLNWHSNHHEKLGWLPWSQSSNFSPLFFLL